MDTFNDEIDEIFSQFRRLTHNLGGSNLAIIGEIITSIKLVLVTNEIKRSRSHIRLEDGLEEKVLEDFDGGNIDGTTG